MSLWEFRAFRSGFEKFHCADSSSENVPVASLDTIDIVAAHLLPDKGEKMFKTRQANGVDHAVNGMPIIYAH